MKKWIWIGVVAVVVIFFYATYNGFVNKEEGLKTAWSNVETQYQRRADLKANQNFLELQAQLEGTENRISVARKEFNEVAKTYNVAVRRFPANLVAKLFGFGQKPYFEAAEGTETAPQVQF